MDDSQFGFVPGRGTTDAIFVVRQLQEKYLAANKRLYMAFVDLEKAFDRVPRKVIWWALRKLGVEEWIVRLVQGMYANAQSRFHVDEGYSEEFEVKVGVHQGSVLSPLLFIIVLEALSWEFRSGVPWEDLYADDLVIITESLEECVRRLLTWKEAKEKKGLRVNAGKMKIMISDMGLDLSVALEWAAAASSVTAASTGCTRNALGSSAWHKGPWLQMYTVPGNCTPFGQQTTEGSPGRTWQAGGGSFLLLPRRHALSSRWLWTFNHNRKKFKDLLPVLSSGHLSFKTRGCVYSSCVRSAMLHAIVLSLGHWQSQTSSVCSEMTGQWSDRSAMSGRKTLSPSGPMSYLCGLALRIWTSFWRREGSAGMDM